MPRIDLDAIEQLNTTGYPPPYHLDVAGRWVRRLAGPAGLSAMGASHVVLKPGAWSSQRHWHAEEDELLIMLAGEAVLVEDGGETVLRAGDVAAWPKGVRNGHHLQNRSDSDCAMVCISAGGERDWGEYPDIDLKFSKGQGYLHKDGTPY